MQKLRMKDIEINGERFETVKMACRFLGLSESSFYKRRQRGWTVVQALTTPLKKNQFG